MRQRAIAAAAVSAFFLAAPTSTPALEAFTSSIPPFSIETGPRAGFVREIVTEMAKRVGRDLPIVYGASWPKSQEEAQTRADTIIFPLARTKTREPQYQWLQKIIDLDVVFATAPGRPAADSEAATRALARVGVRDGSPMAKDLRDRGYTNLVILKTSADYAAMERDGTRARILATYGLK
ncbi:MAG: ABC transporter substrate-binding protein [Proteobacteria bacterium]|nr:ABC transporter substrate-binding protein [Pseudomonadota bacterium]